MMLVRAVSESLPPPVAVKSLKLLLIKERFPSRLFNCALKVFKPVKKADPLLVTLPLSKSSTKMADAHPKLLIAGPKVLTFAKPD